MSDMKPTDLQTNEEKEVNTMSEVTETEVTEEVVTTEELLNESETPQQPEEKKNKMLGRILIIVGVIILILLLLTQCGRNNENGSLPQGNNSAIVDGELDLMDYEEIKAGLQSKVDESYMNLKINLNPVFEGLNGKGNLFIQNSSSNRSNIQVHIYLEENDELVYVSPVLKPNQSISEDVLTNTENLSSGNHKALAMFSIIDPETNEKTSETGIKINLTIK